MNFTASNNHKKQRKKNFCLQFMMSLSFWCFSLYQTRSARCSRATFGPRATGWNEKHLSSRILHSCDRASWHVIVHRDMWPCIVTNFLIIKPPRCTKFWSFILEMKVYMFRTVPLSIIRSYSLYTQQWYMSYRSVDSFRAAAGSGWNCMEFHPDTARKLSTNLYDIYHCWVYSE
jgi:hypothetical protein